MPGHFPVEVGRSMENDFIILLESIGYTILRIRDPASGLDVVAEFSGQPVPRLENRCSLLRPAFAPEGNTVFSLKRGDIDKGDVTELIEKTALWKKSEEDKVLKNASGCVIVTNFMKTEGQLKDILSQGVFCWDIRRLIFYSAKVRENILKGGLGPIREYRLKHIKNVSALIQLTEKTGSAGIKLNLTVFVDDHSPDLSIDAEYVRSVLAEIYKENLKQVLSTTDFDVQVTSRFHFLGIADYDLVKKSYDAYATEASHPRITFNADPAIFQYGAAPWRPLFQF